MKRYKVARNPKGKGWIVVDSEDGSTIATKVRKASARDVAALANSVHTTYGSIT